MKSATIFWLFFMGWLLLSCSKDDDPQDLEPSSKIPDFALLGEDIEDVFLYNYNASPDQGDIVNLTGESNVSRQYLTLRQVDDLLTFYSFSSGNFSAVQRNVTTGENKTWDDFYTVSEERSIIWGANSESQLFLGFFSPRGSSNFGIRIIDPIAREGIDLMLEYNILKAYEPLFHKERLIVTIQGANASFRVAIIDTEANAVLQTLDFGSATPTVFIGGNGDIIILTSTTNNNYEYTAYDFETLVVKDKEMLSLNRFFPPGPLEADFVDGKLYYLNFYAQPSSILFGPAVYDVKTKENRIIDMITIVQEVEQELEAKISLSAFSYEANGNTFLIGFSKLTDNDILEGGVLVISAEGKLLSTINLPFAPTYILK